MWLLRATNPQRIGRLKERKKKKLRKKRQKNKSTSLEDYQAPKINTT
jgi:hypothetical protein